MAGSFMDANDRFLGWTAGNAEDLARVGIEPGSLEMDAFVLLDRQVPLVGLAELPSAVTPTNPE